MSTRRINPRLIKLHRSYSVEEAALVLGTHKNSIRNWIKNGLPTVDRSRPVLMLGHELRDYLERKRKEAKRPCPPGMLYCLKCRQPRAPAMGMIEATRQNADTGNLSAICETCGSMMHRRTRLDAIATIMPNLDVQIREASPRICECASPSLNCDNQKD
ncbi:hypothetical protein Sbs19_22420 [Sphingobium sp. BS19]|nr:hypothetical protein Sbs19_22420 [Sphingobium sp. BS19]